MRAAFAGRTFKSKDFREWIIGRVGEPKGSLYDPQHDTRLSQERRGIFRKQSRDAMRSAVSHALREGKAEFVNRGDGFLVYRLPK